MSEKNSSTGRYDVTAELGRGSMGIVCLAHDPVMNREVAIKTILLPHGLPADEKYEYQQRFLREAQAAGRLSHPGIVTVYDYSQQNDDALPFIAMEYVPGYTLHELIVRDAPLDPNWAVAMADNLADALQSAHHAGVVHRDLKPANILVRESDGAAKITDFGIARISTSELTQAGTTYGSPAYMAPECIRGQRADACSDLYSLAVILYEALSGERPFAGEDYAALCYAIVNDPPVPIRTRQPELSIAFEAFFRRALAKNRDERFQDGASFSKGLESVRLQQERFDSGAATLKMMTPGPAEPVGEATDAAAVSGEATDHAEVREIPLRWVVIGAGTVLLLLLAFGAGWVLNRVASDVPGVASDPAVTATPERATAARAGEGEPGLTAGAPDTARTATEADLGESDTAATEVASNAVEEPEPARPQAPPAAEPAAEKPEEPVVGVTPVIAAAEPDLPTDDPEVVDAAAAVAEVEAPPEADGFAESEPAEPVTVGVNLKNNIKEGTLTLLVDGEEVYAIELATQSGKKLQGAFKKVSGKGQQLVEAQVELPSGSHTVKALVYSTVKDREYETELDVDLEPGDLRTLEIVAGRTFGRQLTMKLD